MLKTKPREEAQSDYIKTFRLGFRKLDFLFAKSRLMRKAVCKRCSGLSSGSLTKILRRRDLSHTVSYLMLFTLLQADNVVIC